MKYLRIILLIIFIIGFFWIYEIGIQRQEKIECEKLQKQSKEYPLFYATDLEIEQCDRYNVSLVDYSCDDCW